MKKENKASFKEFTKYTATSIATSWSGIVYTAILISLGLIIFVILSITSCSKPCLHDDLIKECMLHTDNDLCQIRFEGEEKRCILICEKIKKETPCHKNLLKKKYTKRLKDVN